MPRGFVTPTLLFIGASVLGLLGAFGLYHSEEPTFGAPIQSQQRNIVPETDSEYYLGTTTPSTKAWRGLIVDEICLTGDSCETAWPSGSGSSFGYPFPSNATSTTLTFNGGLVSNSSTTINGTLNFDGETGTQWSDFCVSITGSSDLCDGNDATGGGGGDYPFTTATNFGTTTSATSTPLWLRGHLFSVMASGTAVFENASTSQITIGTDFITDFSTGLAISAAGTVTVATAPALAANGTNCSAGSYALGVDAAGVAEGCTDATTEIDSAIATHAADDDAHQALVTLAGALDYLTLSGQQITRNAIDLATDITGTLDEANIDADIARDSELHAAVTLTGEDYLSLSTQQITANAIDPDNLSASDFGAFTCNGTNCSLDALTVSSTTLNVPNWTNGYLLSASTTATGGMDWVTAASLGLGPGGSDTQIQYNNGGSFGGTLLSYDDTASPAAVFYMTAGGATDDGGGLSFTGAPGGATSGAGGSLTFTAGSAQAGDSNGGFLQFVSGEPSGAGDPGDITFSSYGTISWESGDASNFIRFNNGGVYGIFDFSSIASTNKTFTFPNTTGTLALTANILDDFGQTSLADPGADQLVFWDDSDTAFEFISTLTGLAISGNTLTVNDVTCTDCLNATEIEDLYAFHAGDTYTGAHDFSGASLEIPNGTGPTVDAVGEIAQDTTSNNLVAFDGTNAFVFGQATSSLVSFSISSTSPEAVSGGIKDIPKHRTQARTAVSVSCWVEAGTSQQIFLSDGTNDTNTLTCTTTPSQYALTSNNSWTAYENWRVELATKSGDWDYVNIEILGRITTD